MLLFLNNKLGDISNTFKKKNIYKLLFAFFITSKFREKIMILLHISHSLITLTVIQAAEEHQIVTGITVNKLFFFSWYAFLAFPCFFLLPNNGHPEALVI